jgi:4-amino-4-deoxy-L-arabinose transferase-like glycosyltransferase
VETKAAAPARTRLIRQGSLISDALAVSFVTIVAVAVRLATAGLYSSGISTDEYRYSVIAQEWIRILAGHSTMTLQELVVHHPLVPVTAAIAGVMSGADYLAAGRAVQLGLNAAVVPLLYFLMRVSGLRTAAAVTGAAGLALMPGFWEASAAFLPDSQLAFFSALTFLGVLLGLRGRWWGHWLAAIALGLGFLTKEHLPLVLLPAIATLLLVALTTGQFRLRELWTALLALATAVIVAALLGWLGIGIPRAIVLTRMSSLGSARVIEDGLPPPAPALESETGSAWISSLATAVVNRDIALDWFADAFGLQILSGAVTALGLVGACVLLAARSSRFKAGSTLPGWVPCACVAVPIVLFTAQIAVRRSAEALLVTLVLLAAFALLNSGRVKTRPVEKDWPRSNATPGERAAFWSLLACQSAYVLCTVGFFALRLEEVSFLPRMFLPIMPACALFFGIGCVAVGRVLRPFTERLSAAVIVAVGGAIIGLALPGGPVRKGGGIVAALLLAVTLQWSGMGRRLPHTQTLAALTAGLTLLVGTPALNTIARGREFRGFPEDRYYTAVTGGIRVATFRAAEPWLRTNVRSDEVVITSKPYQVSWHGALGFTGYRASRVWAELAVDRREYLADALLERGNFDWIIDFNQFAVQRDSPEGPLFENDYRWLRARPYLEEAYAIHDAQGRILLYAFRHLRD